MGGLIIGNTGTRKRRNKSNRRWVWRGSADGAVSPEPFCRPSHLEIARQVLLAPRKQAPGRAGLARIVKMSAIGGGSGEGSSINLRRCICRRESIGTIGPAQMGLVAQAHEPKLRQDPPRHAMRVGQDALETTARDGRCTVPAAQSRRVRNG